MPISRRILLRNGSCAVFVAAYASRPTKAPAQSTSTFDYYIGPNGLDSNTGTQAQPWSITAINTRRNVYAGKRVGLLDGIYNVYALHQASAWNSPALSVQGGTAQSPTVIQAVNPRQAIISADSSGGITGGSYPTAGGGIIGQASNNQQQTVWGNVILDGLYITRAYQFGITFWGAGSGEGGTTGNIVRNCEIYDIAGWENNNMCGLQFWQQTGALAQNNLIHSVIPNSGNIALWDCSGISGQNNHGNIYEYNTIYNSNSCIYDKNAHCGGHTYRYNYLESMGTYPNAPLQDCTGGNAGDVSTFHHNIIVGGGAGGGTWNGSDAIAGYCPSHASMVFYNNTCYIPAGSSGVYIPTSGTGTSPTASLTFYNNILAIMSGALGYQGLVQFCNGPGCVALCDYNLYSGVTSTSYYLTRSATSNPAQITEEYSTLALWLVPTGFDAHSIAQKSPLFTKPGYVGVRGTTNPAGYQLANGSPALNAGRTGGTSSGAPCNMGAWDGTVTQIGCNFASGKTPNAPVLTVT
jgi:hypothetical protein